jgi:hypothetical protein
MSDAPRKILNEFSKHRHRINDISDLLRNNYKRCDESEHLNILPHLEKDMSFIRRIQNVPGDKEKSLINLRNAWYNELAFLDKSFGEVQYKFIPWKTIQFYYTIFMSLSSISRCFSSNPNISGHDRMINYFNNQILIRPTLSKKLFVPPFCFVLTKEKEITPPFESVISWKYGLSYKCPSIQECLESCYKENRNTSLFNYFLQLRNWVNYEDSYIFRRLYGESWRPGFYWDMYKIMSSFLMVTESFLSWIYGYEEISKEKDMLVTEYNRYFEPGIEQELRTTNNIEKRFLYYEENKEYLMI